MRAIRIEHASYDQGAHSHVFSCTLTQKKLSVQNMNCVWAMLVAGAWKKSSPPIHSYFSAQPESLTSRALDPAVKYYNKITAMGVKFSTPSQHKGDAQILFRSKGNPANVLAGQIQEIFVHRRPGNAGPEEPISQYFLSVRQYEELSPAEAIFDPYRKYPLLDVRLCRDKLSSDVVIIPLEDIVSHFASCPFKMEDNITGDLRVILSLDRVSHHTGTLAYGLTTISELIIVRSFRKWLTARRS